MQQCQCAMAAAAKGPTVVVLPTAVCGQRGRTVRPRYATHVTLPSLLFSDRSIVPRPPAGRLRPAAQLRRTTTAVAAGGGREGEERTSPESSFNHVHVHPCRPVCRRGKWPAIEPSQPASPQAHASSAARQRPRRMVNALAALPPGWRWTTATTH